MPYVRGTHLTQQNNPVWLGDDRTRDHVLPGGGALDPAAFAELAGFDVVTTSVAAAGSTSIAVAPLEGPIPQGVTLRFGAGVFATLSERAQAGAETLSVEELAAVVASGATARYSPRGRKFVPAGTPVGRSQAAMEGDEPFVPAEAGHHEVYLTLIDIWNLDDDSGAELIRPGAIIYYNHLPTWDGLSSGLQDRLRNDFAVMRAPE